MLTKEESKAVMRSKEFEYFIDKVSKIVERALDGGEDVLGPQLFFEEAVGGGDGDDMKADHNSNQHKERLVPLFAFQDNEPTNRTITSIEWSPKVRKGKILYTFRSLTC